MITSAVVSIVVRNTIFRKTPPSVVSFMSHDTHYGERSINLNKVVATFEKHTFLSQTDLTRTGIFGETLVCHRSYIIAARSTYAIDQKINHLHNDRVTNMWRNNVPSVCGRELT